jgi:hypothetical protein
MLGNPTKSSEINLKTFTEKLTENATEVVKNKLRKNGYWNRKFDIILRLQRNYSKQEYNKKLIP